MLNYFNKGPSSFTKQGSVKSSDDLGYLEARAAEFTKGTL